MVVHNAVETNMSSLNDLVTDYLQRANTLNEREKAELELKIFDAAKLERKETSRQPYDTLRDLLKLESGFAYRCRRELAMFGSELLWERVLRHNMPVSTAVTLYRGASIRARATKNSLESALIDTLNEYDKRFPKLMPNGKFIRARSPKGMRGVSKCAEVVVIEPKNFWDGIRNSTAQIRNSTLEYASQRLSKSNATGVEVQKLCDRFEADVKTAIEEFQKALDLLARRRDASEAVTRKQVMEACHELNMDPPAPGKPVDQLKAKRQKKLHVRLYHPDVHPNPTMKTAMRKKYESVLEAYRTIEQYNSECGEG